MKKASAMYCRVSSTTQEKEGSSLESQQEYCLAKASSEVPPQYTFIETASGLGGLDRPELTKLRKAAENREIFEVIIYSPDRLARKGEDILYLIKELKEHDVKTIFVKEEFEDSPTGKLVAFVYGWASELEANQLKDRSRRGFQKRAESGKIPRGRRLYGFTYVPGKGEGEGIRYLNEDISQWIRQWKDWILYDGWTVKQVMWRMRASNVKTPKGKDPRYWSPHTIYGILTNPAIMGKTYAYTYDCVEVEADNGKKRKKRVQKPIEQWMEIPGATPAIITEEEFKQLQQRLKRNRLLSKRNTKTEYLLSGYVFCGLDNRRYSGKLTRPKGGYKPTRYYYCPRKDRTVSPDRCLNKNWRADTLEEVVWSKIELLLQHPEVVLAEVKAIEGMDRESQIQRWQHSLQDIQQSLDNMDTEQTKLLDDTLFDELGFTKELVKKRNCEINTKRGELLKQRDELQSNIERLTDAASTIKSIERFCELARTNLGTFTFEDKRLALEALNIKVWVNYNEVAIEGSIPIPEGESSLPIDFVTPRCSESGRVKVDVVRVSIAACWMFYAGNIQPLPISIDTG